MSWLNKILHIIDSISEWSGKGVSFLTATLIGVITYEVIARYIFNSPTSWAVETGTFIFAVMWLFSGGYVMKHRSHIKVDIFYARFSPRTQAIINAVSAPLVFIMLGILLWITLKFALRSIDHLERSGSQWGPPIYVIKTLIPIGAFFHLLQAVANLVRDVHMAVRDKELK